MNLSCASVFSSSLYMCSTCVCMCASCVSASAINKDFRVMETRAPERRKEFAVGTLIQRFENTILEELRNIFVPMQSAKTTVAINGIASSADPSGDSVWELDCVVVWKLGET